MPNVLMSPHIAGISPHYPDRAVALFCDNLTRYLSGQPLLNRYDLSLRY
jgi:phosphoglycerate dehydrogenase-like enzyme